MMKTRLRNNFYLIAFLILSSCGSSVLLIEQEFQEYIDRFEKYGNIIIVDLNIHFGSIEDPFVMGFCKWGHSGTPEIVISFYHWDYITTDLEKESLVFHELGHCVLDRRHREDVLDNMAPASIMYPFALSHNVYYNNHQYYIEELFSYQD